MVGVRAIAFMLMTSYNTGFVLLRHPSISSATRIQTFIAVVFYGFDIWFFVSGFTLAVDLSKNWQKNHSLKFVFMIFLRGFIQIWLISIFILICIKVCLHNFGGGALWDLVIDYL